MSAYGCRRESACLRRCRLTIAARIDRLAPAAKGSLERRVRDRVAIEHRLPDRRCRSSRDLAEAVKAELFDQVSVSPRAEYAFHHPLIRTVAYESQLKSDRAELHRSVARVIEARDPTGIDENAALIAEHVQAAGDVPEAYGWHMRAASWLSKQGSRRSVRELGAGSRMRRRVIAATSHIAPRCESRRE